MSSLASGRFIYIWMFLLAFFVSSCKSTVFSDLQFMTAEEDQLSKKSDIFILLDYFRYLESLSESEMNKEHTRLELWFSKEHKLMDRLKLAILLSRANTPYQDYERSLGLLTEYSQDPARNDRLLRELSFLLSYFIHRMKNGEEDRQDLVRHLEETGKRNEILEAESKRTGERERTQKVKIKQLEKRNKRFKRDRLKQKKEREKLQKMIDGLKTIEKNLMKREPVFRSPSGEKSNE